MHSRVLTDTSPNCAAGEPAARQAAGSGAGTADARRADESAAAAVPSGEPWRWAPRPKADPLTQEPECGWQAARNIQRKRRAAHTAAKRNPRQMKDAGGGAFIVARSVAAADAERARLACPIEQAAIALRRRGVIVYRMSVHGGAPDLFFVSSIGRDVSAADLILAAGKLKA